MICGAASSSISPRGRSAFQYAAKFAWAIAGHMPGQERCNRFPLESICEEMHLSLRLAHSPRRIRKSAMTEKAYRFSASAIDELNKHRGLQRLPARQFALLMAGLVALLLLLYVQIVW
jgi:hypothetical protein